MTKRKPRESGVPNAVIKHIVKIAYESGYKKGVYNTLVGSGSVFVPGVGLIVGLLGSSNDLKKEEHPKGANGFPPSPSSKRYVRSGK